MQKSINIKAKAKKIVVKPLEIEELMEKTIKVDALV
jgi:hypothetical protein